MKLRLNDTNINPCIIHASGKREYNPLLEVIELPTKKIINQFENIAIITWNRKNPKYQNHYKSLGLFESCCEKIGIVPEVLTCEKEWSTNRLKISLTLEFLKSCDKEFVLGADSSDAIIYNLPNPEILNNKKCDMLFNAEKTFWPTDLVDLKEKEEHLEKGFFRYLNSGVWLAKKNYALEVFEELNANINTHLEYSKSDQILFKYLYIKQYPRMQLDVACECFLNCSHLAQINFQKNQNKLFV